MLERFANFPKSLQPLTRTVRIPSRVAEEIPALLIHPDWKTPAPVVIWMHGRTAYKELDAGRFQRWLRAGVAACSIDLPGHGERFDSEMQSAESTLRMVRQGVAEIDSVIDGLADPIHAGAFDIDRMGVGGMSAGGIVALRRLCDPHAFRCAGVEGTTGSLEQMPMYESRHGRELLDAMNPIKHLETWRAIPLLALHSEADAWVPVAGIRSFVEALRARYRAAGADDSRVQLVTWPNTGAPHEHLGFGRVSNDAKNLQSEFFRRQLNS
jgi:dipeptidyl aminopeptidase/acylaminoacyl peptidase